MRWIQRLETVSLMESLGPLLRGTEGQRLLRIENSRDRAESFIRLALHHSSVSLELLKGTDTRLQCQSGDHWAVLVGGSLVLDLGFPSVGPTFYPRVMFEQIWQTTRIYRSIGY